MSTILIRDTPQILINEPKKKPCLSKACWDEFNAVVIHPDTPSWFGAVGGLARAVASIARPFVKLTETVMRSLAATQFTCIFTLPFDFYQFLSDSRDLAIKKGRQARLDNAVGMLGDLSQVSDGVGTYISALSDVGAISSSVMRWVAPLTLASALASSIFFFISGRGLYYNVKLLRELKKVPCTQEALLEMVKKHSYHLERQCGVDTKLFIKTISGLKLNEQEIKKAYEALKRRIHRKEFTYALSILITTIGIIASILFFAASALLPVAIAASALLVALSPLAMSKMALEMYANRRFNLLVLSSCLK